MDKRIRHIKGMQRLPNYSDVLYSLNYLLEHNPTAEEVSNIKQLRDRAKIIEPDFNTPKPPNKGG